MLLKRLLNLNLLLNKKSHFLFGPRGTGKSTLVAQQLPNARVYDLLDDEVYERLLRRPKIIEEEAIEPGKITVIDEIQRLPKILNEVHRLIAKSSSVFLLTGSSARKLRRGSSNLLGGRAWESHLHPLVSTEIENFDLLRYLNQGGLPAIYLADNSKEALRNYVRLYLREEIFAEGIVRKQEYFVSFLDIIALQNGQELSFQNMADESGVPPRTIQNYVQILEDTLAGFQVKPIYSKIRKAVARSKFYFFDLGVANSLAKRGEIEEGGEAFGRSFEHFIGREIRSYLDYSGSDKNLYYWRVASGPEVDFVIEKECAIEVKATKLVSEGHLKALKYFREEGLVKSYLIVSRDSSERIVDGIRILPWQNFLRGLWDGKFF